MKIKKDLVSINENPLQTHAQHTVIKKVTLAGPSKEGDRRIYLDKKTLLKLADIASSSLVQRVQINRAGVEVKLFQRPDGHTYEVWTLIGLEPVPESSMDGLFVNPND